MALEIISNLVCDLKAHDYSDVDAGKKIALAAKAAGMTFHRVFGIMEEYHGYKPEVGSSDIYENARYHYYHSGGNRHRRTHRGARKTHRRTHRKSGKSHRRGRKTRRH